MSSLFAGTFLCSSSITHNVETNVFLKFSRHRLHYARVFPKKYCCGQHFVESPISNIGGNPEQLSPNLPAGQRGPDGALYVGIKSQLSVMTM